MVDPEAMILRLLAPTLRMTVLQFLMKIRSPALAKPVLYLKLPEYFCDILRSKLKRRIYRSFCTNALVLRVVKSKCTPEICLYVEEGAKLPKSEMAVAEVGRTLIAASTILQANLRAE